MKRLEIFAMVVAGCLTGCNSTTTTTPNPIPTQTIQVPVAGPTPSATMIHEFPTTDTLLGGMDIGSDGNLYASTTVALDVFVPKQLTSTLSERFVRPLTWPNVHAPAHWARFGRSERDDLRPRTARRNAAAGSSLNHRRCGTCSARTKRLCAGARDAHDR